MNFVHGAALSSPCELARIGTGGERRLRAARSPTPPTAKLSPKRREDAPLPPNVFRTIGMWKCVKNCGACCYLEPRERENLEDFLSPDELVLYFSLVGPDGWCVHYNKDDRTCGIYKDRPNFCRVSRHRFEKVLGASTEEDFQVQAVDSCLDHIFGIYGPRSQELHAYAQTVGVDLTEEEEGEEDDDVDDEDEDPLKRPRQGASRLPLGQKELELFEELRQNLEEE